MSADAPTENRRKLWTAVRIALALIGLGVIAWMVHDIGLAKIQALVVPALPWLPLVAALELLRVGADACASYFVLRRRAELVPLSQLFWAHVVGYAVMAVTPAGRASAEATKSALLSRYLGGGAAVALGTTNQANTLISSGLFTLPCAAAFFAISGPSVLMWACLGHTVFMMTTGLVLRGAQRHRGLGGMLQRRFPKLAPSTGIFFEASRESAAFDIKPVGAMFFGRVLQATAYGVIAFAVGLPIGVDRALAVQGVNLVSAAIGVLVPGQVGSSEGVFGLAAQALGTDLARATSIALLAHVVQLALTVFGFGVLFFWRTRRKADEAEEETEPAELSARRATTDPETS